ncbi:hypothetical protein A3781_08175 [Bacillus badius]|nr:hypothetical protein A3781_08175 [Bacillus badius]
MVSFHEIGTFSFLKKEKNSEVFFKKDNKMTRPTIFLLIRKGDRPVLSMLFRLTKKFSLFTIYLNDLLLEEKSYIMPMSFITFIIQGRMIL